MFVFSKETGYSITIGGKQTFKMFKNMTGEKEKLFFPDLTI